MSQRSKTARVIQVPIDEELHSRVTLQAKKRRESRAAFIRRACTHFLRSLEMEELERRYEEGYRRVPEDVRFAKTAVRLAAAVFSPEEW